MQVKDACVHSVDFIRAQNRKQSHVNNGSRQSHLNNGRIWLQKVAPKMQQIADRTVAYKIGCMKEKRTELAEQ